VLHYQFRVTLTGTPKPLFQPQALVAGFHNMATSGTLDKFRVTPDHPHKSCGRRGIMRHRECLRRPAGRRACPRWPTSEPSGGTPPHSSGTRMFLFCTPGQLKGNPGKPSWESPKGLVTWHIPIQIPRYGVRGAVGRLDRQPTLREADLTGGMFDRVRPISTSGAPSLEAPTKPVERPAEQGYRTVCVIALTPPSSSARR
jgi:hypothetical protein